MWIVELSFDGNPARLAARPAHRQILAALYDEGVVRMAGPFADESGAIVIIDAPDRSTVEQILAEDPYYGTDGVTVVSIRDWQPFLT